MAETHSERKSSRWSLQNATALVTGGTKGIGYAIVEELAAHATMKEADDMLNALLTENRNAKMWQLASEELRAERASLIAEVEELRYSITLKEKENELLQEQMNDSLAEISSSISLLERCFMQMQSQGEESFQVLYSIILSTREDVLHSISNSRLSLEEVFLEMMEREFTMFVLYQCHVGEFIRQKFEHKCRIRCSAAQNA